MGWHPPGLWPRRELQGASTCEWFLLLWCAVLSAAMGAYLVGAAPLCGSLGGA